MNYNEAVAKDPAGWSGPIEDEWNRMVDHKVMEVIPKTEVPEGRKIISTTWAMKQKANGVKRARLVARGFEEVPHLDYDPSGKFAPVVTIVGWKVVMVLVLVMRLIAEVVDVKGAFLTGSLEDNPVYMEVPQGFETKINPETHAIKLLKAIYGLVQAAHLYWRKATEHMVNRMKLHRNKVDNCIYHKWNGDKLILWTTWVDDMIVAGSTQTEIDDEKKGLAEEFKTSELGPLNEYVGCKIEHDREAGTMKFTQPVLIQSFEDEFEIPEKIRDQSPAIAGQVLKDEEDQPLDKETQSLYRKAVGKLLFLCRISRNDIQNAVRETTKFVKGAWQTQLNAAY